MLAVEKFSFFSFLYDYPIKYLVVAAHGYNVEVLLLLSAR